MPNTVDTALDAASSALLLTRPSEVARAQKAWRRCEVLALDTEFVRERTYFAKLGLVQISDGITVWLVDPLNVDCLSPIKSLLEDSSVTKLVHSPSEDLEVLLNEVGALPDPMIDTQAACALLGQPLQLAYHAAAEWLLGVQVAKDQTRSNWLRRPLGSAQLRYAALDVCLLPEMWCRLRKELESKGRLAWLAEDCALQVKNARTVTPDGSAWQRIRGADRLDGVGLAIIQALAAWREKEARSRDLPRGFIVPDPILLQFAHNKYRDDRNLESLDDLHPRARQRFGNRMVQLAAEVIDSGSKLEEIAPFSAAERKSLARLREAVKEQAARLNIDPALIASRRELEGLVRLAPGEWPDKFKGWRHRLMGAELERLAG